MGKPPENARAWWWPLDDPPDALEWAVTDFDVEITGYSFEVKNYLT
jgi:hypothetical protein